MNDLDIDSDIFFRYFYLPFVIMDVFYDYVDTILDQMKVLRIEALKKLSRSLKDLRADYNYLKFRFLDYKHRTEQNEHMEYFIDMYSKEFSSEFNLIKWKVSSNRKMLLPDWQIFIASVYMGICVYFALKDYSKEADVEIAKHWGEAKRSILPEMITKNILFT